MKKQLKNVLSSRVHCLMFILVCVLLAGVVWSAKIMADRISSEFIVVSDDDVASATIVLDS